jgi:hypothetical protein
VNHLEILSRLIDNPTSDVLYSITMQHVLQQIVYRIGDNALSLTQADLELAREEVVAAINHSLDCRPYIDEGLDAWTITRHLYSLVVHVTFSRELSGTGTSRPEGTRKDRRLFALFVRGPPVIKA